MTEDDKQEPFALRITDAARYLGVCRSTLYAIVKKGDLVIRSVGGRSVILREDLEMYARSAPVSPWLGSTGRTARQRVNREARPA